MARRDDGPYKKGAKVIATQDLRGVPEGTRGKVALINGLTWIRYWVFFENGASLGSLDGSKLVYADEWEQYKIDRAKAADAAVADAEAAEKAEAATKDKAVDEKPAEAKSQIPAHLLERAKKAKEKKAVDDKPAEADEKPAEAKSQIPAHLLERAKKAKEKKAAAGG